ncbi:HAD family hydrolase [Kitasatospora xanthocidica]|uniref:HAD family hydrolase n=1 Tax=Kitasatospora xanthocidica TaxID=83382 RepID=A0A373A0B6_9ACTN|nr:MULTISPECIES: HAD-IA family hydrolase [Streptomycetaceae]OKI10500.1 HAD family hydrolase [Streptomyces sp. CB02056]RGD61194.1 HAD family hydrolase [Kitasatospora xanthocidica]
MTAAPVRLTARALLLDMDGTLVNSDAVVERCFSRWAERNGLDPAEVLAVAHGRQGHATMALLLPDRPAELNLADNERILAEERADTEGVVPVPGAAAFLASLTGLPHALVTSADLPLARIRMTAAGLPMPSVLVTAESVGASKPDPEGFLKGAADLGFAPADCLAFEDSGAGIAAAKAAGVRVVGVGPRALPHHPDAHADTLTTVTVTAAPDGLLTVTVG